MNHRSVYVTSACTLALVFSAPQSARAVPVVITGTISPSFQQPSPPFMHLFFGDSAYSNYLTNYFGSSYIEVTPDGGGGSFTGGPQNFTLSFDTGSFSNIDTIDIWAGDYSTGGPAGMAFMASGDQSGGNFAYLGSFSYDPLLQNQPLIFTGQNASFTFGDPVQPLAGGLGGTINATTGVPELDGAGTVTPMMVLFGALAAGARRKRKVRADQD